MPATASILNQIADEVVAALNAAVAAEAFGAVTFDAKRVKRPRFELAGDEALAVQVYPMSIREERISRTDWQGDFAVGIGVVKAVTKDAQLAESEIDQEDAAESDACDLLVEQIVELFKDEPVLAPSGATLITVRYHSDPQNPDAPYSAQELSTEHVHAAQVVLTFRGR